MSHQRDKGPQTYLPGSASLLEDLDKKLIVVLRDGRNLIGILRCIDQFANLVLHETVERIYVGRQYGDIPRGIFLIRGDNVGLIGEIDLDKEKTSALEKVSFDVILDAQKRETDIRNKVKEARAKAMKERGLCLQDDGFNEDNF